MYRKNVTGIDIYQKYRYTDITTFASKIALKAIASSARYTAVKIEYIKLIIRPPLHILFL